MKNDINDQIIEALLKIEPNMDDKRSGNFVFGIIEALQFLELIQTTKTEILPKEQGWIGPIHKMSDIKNDDGVSIMEVLFQALPISTLVDTMMLPDNIDSIATPGDRAKAVVEFTLSEFERDPEGDVTPEDWEAFSGVLFCFHELGLIETKRFGEIMNQMLHIHGLKAVRLKLFVSQEFGLSPSLLSSRS